MKIAFFAFTPQFLFVVELGRERFALISIKAARFSSFQRGRMFAGLLNRYDFLRVTVVQSFSSISAAQFGGRQIWCTFTNDA